MIGWLVLMTILGVGLAAVAAISNQEKDSLNKEQIKKEGMALIGYMITCAILIVSGVVFFIIILRCYKYLRDVRSLSDNRGVSLSLIA